MIRYRIPSRLPRRYPVPNCAVVICLALLVLSACRDRPRYVGPESLIFDVQLGPDLVRQTVIGTVQCPTCPPHETTMLIDLYLPQRNATTPVTSVGFGQLGSYSITASVPYGELLEIRATLFTAGGPRTTGGSTYATDDEDLEAAEIRVDLAVP